MGSLGRHSCRHQGPRRKETVVNPPASPGHAKKAATLMLQGTASNVGKSVLTAALCRIFSQDGFRVAPFKSQNMALNSYVTLTGHEIGRAQGSQAEAAGIPATTDMNPILLKPKSDGVAEVILQGRSVGDMSAHEYRERFIPQALSAVRQSLERLRSEFDLVVIEGAGSPAEVNLKDRDIANMRVAEMADAPVLLVADIDRGGVFASIVGTLELLEPAERDRVAGFLINRFRGERSLLEPGLHWLEARTGKPVLGVIPYLEEVGVEPEDSLSFGSGSVGGFLDTAGDSVAPDCLRVAVITFPRLSNFTDLDPLLAEEDVYAYPVRRPQELGDPDLILLPGSKNTIDDLAYLRRTGLAPAIQAKAAGGTFVVGICGGYQMLGRELHDPEQVEGSPLTRQTQETDFSSSSLPGLGLLDTVTHFQRKKEVRRRSGHVEAIPGPVGQCKGLSVEGYEIHLGRTELGRNAQAFARLDNGNLDGAVSQDGRIFGTYLHGLFESDSFRRGFLNALRREKGLPPRTLAPVSSRRQVLLDRLAETVRSSVDLEAVYRLLDLPSGRAAR